MKRICVFCGANPGKNPIYQEYAEALAYALVRRGTALVYGGGNVGLMGIIADAVLSAGGDVIGVIPDFLADRELAHPNLTELHLVDSMHTRKAMMAELSDGFIAMPGGFGTFEEFCEIVTWSQLGLHPKPQGLLNVAGYYTPLIEMFDKAVSEGFVSPHHRGMVLESPDPDLLLEKMAAYVPVPTPRWIHEDETMEKT